MTLSTTDFINGLFALIFAVVTITIGLRIASKYFEFKHKTFLYIGIGWAGFSSGWWGSGFGFLYYVLSNRFFEDTFYIFIQVFFVPLFTYLVFYGLTELIFKGNKKFMFRVIFLLIDLLFMIYLLIFIILDPSQIGVKTGTFDLTFGIVVIIYLVFGAILPIAIGGLIFSYNGIKSSNKELNIKGKILVLAFILFLIGVILDAMLVLTELTLIITRSILTGCSVLFYLGYLLPDWFKRIFINED
ncbi:MAG: hypothetical protein EU535_02005 [Promethearchaeota archaeon]|nr:MAG: hypothetical protein EU535_02005 [Candidatus Lokiarchaeota archaeon]